MLEQNQHFSRRIVDHSVRKDVVHADGGTDTRRRRRRKIPFFVSKQRFTTCISTCMGENMFYHVFTNEDKYSHF